MSYFPQVPCAFLSSPHHGVKFLICLLSVLIDNMWHSGRRVERAGALPGAQLLGVWFPAPLLCAFEEDKDPRTMKFTIKENIIMNLINLSQRLSTMTSNKCRYNYFYSFFQVCESSISPTMTEGLQCRNTTVLHKILNSSITDIEDQIMLQRLSNQLLPYIQMRILVAPLSCSK